ncbi:MAG: 30S ribosome-binding factor RbfA [Gammaproteobacteria bacterium]|nr:30S ribosome-binding factor RbfA [Gammaproteobacteria bacterium]NNC97026.1 30S ribosome-binding factor RbfA [Gammaproteobacteria bacterium]NNM13868.1 30S ribosome-binding factor RbfA [Gammaproteobacteria bacterium]
MAKRDFARNSRVAQEVQRLLNGYLQREMDDEALRLVSLNEVKVTNDLSYAKVYWRSISNDFDQSALQNKLTDVAKKLRYLLSQEMQIRKVPELKFIYDSSIDHAAHIDSLLAKTRELSKQVQVNGEEE